jgi:nucleoside-diphosphate-sugar epimerase
VTANVLAAEVREIPNVASGRSETVNALAEVLGRRAAGREGVPPGAHRRRTPLLADVSAARRLLGHEPEVGFEEGPRLTADASVRV